VASLGLPSRFDYQAGSRTLYAGDFNGDGKLDLLVDDSYYSTLPGQNYAYDIRYLLLGNGDGTFQKTIYVVGDSLADPVINHSSGDFNGDGIPDRIVTNFQFTDIEAGTGLEVVSFLAGNADGRFQAPQIVLQVAGSEQVPGPLIGDFNGDGKLDLLLPFVTAYSTLDTSTSFEVLLGNGDGTFQTAGAFPTAMFPGAVPVADFNGDGRLDAIWESDHQSITILLGDGEGGYRISQQIPRGTYGGLGSPLVEDFNGDGRPDMAFIITGPGPTDGTRLAVLLGNGDGTFQATVYPIPDGSTYEVEVGGIYYPLAYQVTVGGFDFSIGTDRSTLTFLGSGDGSSEPGNVDLSLSGVKFIGTPVFADFNGDGQLDAAVAGIVNGSSEIFVFLGDGKGGYSLSQTIADPTFNDPLLGDFNGDGKLDLATLEEGLGNNPASVLVYLGHGDGTFDPARTEPLGDYAGPYGDYTRTQMAAAAFDGGGKSDLLTWDPVNQRVYILRLNRDGTFQPPELVPAPTTFTSVSIVDITGNGRPDLSFSGATTGLLLNNGDGTFSDASQAFSGASQVVISPHDSPLVADVNGDGTDDVLMVDGHGNILYRQGRPSQPGTFDPPVTINGGSPSRAIAWLPDTAEGPLLASVDAQDDAVTLYSYQGGRFVVAGSLTTGLLPAQFVAADLNRDGLYDLVVRNAGDGTLSVFLNDSQIPLASHPGMLFFPSATIDVGPGVSDVQAIDTTGDGSPDLVITNSLTGQVSVLVNDGYGHFAPPVPYRAGTSFSEVDASSGSPRVTGLDATGGLAIGPLTLGSPISLIAANTGTETIDLLQGLGGGAIANPTEVLGTIKAIAVCAADLNHDGNLDLAVLTDQGVSVLLGDGKGGFLPPVTYDAGPDPSGLTIADVDGDGNPDLVVSNPYGDVLVLLNRGDGTFAPYHNTDQSITLAVADLTGDGSKDVIYADQGLDRVVVDYGAGNSTVLGDRSSGLLSPGAVKLADLNGDGIPDLIVANSGSNNVLIFPGLGNGQFGPAVNGGHGFFTGTNPAGLAVADLNGDGIPDLIVANSGSNDVSILIGQGTGSSWTLTPGPRIKTDAGPVAVAVGPFLGNGQVDLAVANQQANNVQVFPGLGGGYFNDTAPVTYPVGQSPSGLFAGNFTGSGLSLATLNAGSSTISLIGPTGVIQTIGAGGLRPVSGFAGDFNGNGFTDLVVGDNGNGRIALFAGSPDGLTLSQTITSEDVPSPTSLSFAGVADGVLSFYAGTEGREAATLLAFNLFEGEGNAGGAGTGVTGEGLAGATEPSAAPALASATAGVFQQVAQLLGRSGSPLDLVAPLFTVSVIPGEFDVASSGEGGVALIANFTPGAGPGAPGQSLGPHDDGPAGEAEESPAPVESDASMARDEAKALPLWGRMAIGLEKAFEQVRAERLEKEGVDLGAAGRADPTPGGSVPPAPAQERSSDGPGRERRRPVGEADPRAEAIEELVAESDAGWRPRLGSSIGQQEIRAIPRDRLCGPVVAAVVVASATMIGGYVKSGRSRRRMLGPAQGPSIW
jgi:hypothetical protein